MSDILPSHTTPTALAMSSVRHLDMFVILFVI
jgi:hypothetical protein